MSAATTPLRDDDVIQTTEGLVFNPFNANNIVIGLNDVHTILESYGIPPTVVSMGLYERAFVHRSYTKRPAYENDSNGVHLAPALPNCLPLKTKSNERLEFLGDGVLECVAKYYLYRRFPKQNEGFMTEKKIAIVKNETIGRIALEMGLQRWVVLSRSAEEKGMRTNLKKLGCLFEAFIGALFLDFNKTVVQDEEGWFQSMFVTGPGFQMAQKFIEAVFEKHIDWTELIQTDDNFKNILQVKIQKEFKVTPHYLAAPSEDDGMFRMGVYLCLGQPIHTVNRTSAEDISRFATIADIRRHVAANSGRAFLLLGTGTHRIKRKAEQCACETALSRMPDFSRGGGAAEV